MKIGICSDHAGLDLKKRLHSWLESKSIDIVDFGTDSPQSCDYTDYAHPLAEGLRNTEVDLGIALCGTGNGMMMTLNRHQGVRACLAWSKEIATLVKQHNNANILVMPARFLSYEQAEEIVKAWMEAEFEGGRHQRRLDKLDI